MNETIIAWATHTLNVVHGCSKPAAVPEAGMKIYREWFANRKWFANQRKLEEVILAKWRKPNTSPECVRCYAENLSNRRGQYAQRNGKEPKGWTVKPWTEANAQENVHLHPERFRQLKSLPFIPMDLPPSQRNRIFICSMGDVFHELVPASFLEELFYWLRAVPHIIMLLTKRPDRAAAWPGPWPEHIWLGTTCGHPITKWRLEYLRRSKAAVRFVSMEPLLASMTDSAANAVLGELNLRGIDQVIVGGESGTGFRKMDMAWARGVRDACGAAGTAFFYKQDADFQTERRCYLVEEDGARNQYRQFPGEMTAPTPMATTGPDFRILAG